MDQRLPITELRAWLKIMLGDGVDRYSDARVVGRFNAMHAFYGIETLNRWRWRKV